MRWRRGPREAQAIMGGLFLVAAGVMVVAVPPALALGGRPARRRCPPERSRGRDGAAARHAPGAVSMPLTTRVHLAL